ncbi:hypothetical protein VTL71DRAFT_11371 [Oculimacula yallundae]|uniref:Ubiquitin-like domain-containing protein n=1 Tax=Oculimacula yallundae TaxID=86028 RepID=A0ABR4CQL2_9HELO
MAEIGLIASIIGIAGAGAKISKGLWDVAKAFGSAGKDVKLVASEISTLCRVFTQLGKTLTGESEAARNAERLAGDVLEMCDDLLKESQELLDVLKPLVEMSEHHFGKSKLRLQWLFKKSKFAAHKQSLGMLQGTLTLLFSGMTYAVAIETRETESTKSLLRADLENSKSSVQEHSRAYLGLTGIIQNGTLQIEILSEYTGLSIDAPTTDWRPETGDRIEEQPTGDKSETGNNPIHPQNSSNSFVTEETTANGMEDPNNMALALRSRSMNTEEYESDSYEMQDDLQFRASEQVLDFFIKLEFIQRRTVRFAEYALDPRTEEIWEAQATARAVVVDPPINFPSQNSRDDSSSGRSQQDYLQKPQSDDRSRRSSGNDFQTSDHQAVSPSTVHRGEDEEVLNFTDSRGWKFKFPWEQCRTYEGLIASIKEIYQSDQTYQYALQYDDFNLYGTVYGKEGQVITSETYKRHIRPGQQVSIEFVDSSLNKSQTSGSKSRLTSMFRKR